MCVCVCVCVCLCLPGGIAEQTPFQVASKSRVERRFFATVCCCEYVVSNSSKLCTFLVRGVRVIRVMLVIRPYRYMNVFRNTFMIYLCISPDLDGYRALNRTGDGYTICFTICLFISLDLDGHRAPKYSSSPSALRLQKVLSISKRK